MAVGAHDEQVDVLALTASAITVSGAPEIAWLVTVVAGARSLSAASFRYHFALSSTCPARRMWQAAPLSRGLAMSEVERLGRARTAVVGDEKSLDRPEGARDDEHGADGRANDPLEIAAEMRLGDFGVFAALADDDELAARFEFFERFNERAVALSRRDIDDARGRRVGGARRRGWLCL